jgi:hypothetical protein
MKTAYTNFALGLLYGFGLGVLLDQASLVNLTSFSLLIAFLVLVPALGWLESYNHRRRVENWPRIQAQGKFRFVITRYVLLRGGIIAALLMYSLRDRIGFGLIHEIAIPVLIVAVAIVGFQEWANCEKAFATPLTWRREAKED